MTQVVHWRDILYSGHRLWKDLEEFFEFAMQSGYKFFAWNGRIYFITNRMYMDTGWTVDNFPIQGKGDDND